LASLATLELGVSIGRALDFFPGNITSFMLMFENILPGRSEAELPLLSEKPPELWGWNAGAVGLKVGPPAMKLKSEFDGEKAFDTGEKPGEPNTAGLGLKTGAAALRPLADAFEEWREARSTGAKASVEVGTNALALDGWNEKVDCPKMAGLNVALGFPEGVNGLAAMLSLDIEDLEEWCDIDGLAFSGEGDRGLKVGSFAHGLAAEVIMDSAVLEIVADLSVSLGLVSTSDTTDRGLLTLEAGWTVPGAWTEPFAILSDVLRWGSSKGFGGLALASLPSLPSHSAEVLGVNLSSSSSCLAIDSSRW
jgi:hypothetical protein